MEHYLSLRLVILPHRRFVQIQLFNRVLGLPVTWNMMPQNPLDPCEHLHIDNHDTQVQHDAVVHPQTTPLPEDSATTKAEKLERHGLQTNSDSPIKRRKTDNDDHRVKGIAPIKAEFRVISVASRRDNVPHDDDAAEGAHHLDGPGHRNKKKSQGQNHARDFGSSKDEIGLCQSRANYAEFSPAICQYGDACRFEHDLRRYLGEWKREDLQTFGQRCPILDVKSQCDAGWRCRFVGSHRGIRETSDGRQELIMLDRDGQPVNGLTKPGRHDLINDVSTEAKMELARRRFKTPKAEQYTKWIEANGKVQALKEGGGKADEDNRAQYTEPPFLPSEKRKIYFGRDTPVLAPLTTQGNLPFRRLCVELGAQATYSEMAMSLPLIQGQKSEWALLRGHHTEAQPPMHKGSTVADYQNSKDLKFGAQIAANKAWQALKATEILTALCPSLRVVDLNCGCPIDLVYRQGAGSALLDSAGKLEKMLRGMNSVSGEVPITVKIRMGTKDGRPTAIKLTDRLAYGGSDAQELGLGGAGIAAITLHGRSRQQRYTRSADWEYIAECATVIKAYNEKNAQLRDTVHEIDPRNMSPSSKAEPTVYFLGNGDCYSHVDYFEHLEKSKVDSVMLGRGALIKPWIFEEIAGGCYLDKSATERLAYVEKYARYGLETWGSDERGIGTTRRFLLEWLSFAYRYVPLGILEHLPPRLQDRPPAWRGRDDLETLLGSDDYKDWIKIR